MRVGEVQVDGLERIGCQQRIHPLEVPLDELDVWQRVRFGGSDCLEQRFRGNVNPHEIGSGIFKRQGAEEVCGPTADLQPERQMIAEQVGRVDRRKHIRVPEELLATEEEQVALDRPRIGRLKACPAQK